MNLSGWIGFVSPKFVSLKVEFCRGVIIAGNLYIVLVEEVEN